MNFKEEARILVKQILEEWEATKDFDTVTAILEDYLTDIDTEYQSLINKL